MIDEEWRAIPDEPNYQASSAGRVRSVDHVVLERSGRRRKIKGRVLKARLDPESGYPHCMIGAGKTRRVHQLVAWAFHGPQPSGSYVRHRDGHRANNVPANLLYGSATDNQKDRRTHPTSNCGMKHHNARLSDGQVLEIHRRALAGETQPKLAEEFGVSQATISNIKHRRSWGLLLNGH